MSHKISGGWTYNVWRGHLLLFSDTCASRENAEKFAWRTINDRVPKEMRSTVSAEIWSPTNTLYRLYWDAHGFHTWRRV